MQKGYSHVFVARATFLSRLFVDTRDLRYQKDPHLNHKEQFYLPYDLNDFSKAITSLDSATNRQVYKFFWGCSSA